MLSRVAERMYWAGRYLERVENTARLVMAYDSLLLDLPPDAGVDWRRLLQIVAAEAAFDTRYKVADEKNILTFLLADTDNPGSVMASLGYTRENVRTSRDIVPREGWECVNELYLMGREQLGKAVGRRKRFAVLSDCIVRCQQVTGLLSGTMSHGQAYGFLRAGNYLERADMTSRVVDVAALNVTADGSGAAYENTRWMGVLKSLSAYQMYRQYVRRRVAPADVVSFLIQDPKFPRAVSKMLTALGEAVQMLPHHEEVAATAAKLRQTIETADVGAMPAAELHSFIDEFQIGLAGLHTRIDETWFLKQTAQ